jgi:hypothetical protein
MRIGTLQDWPAPRVTLPNEKPLPLKAALPALHVYVPIWSGTRPAGYVSLKVIPLTDDAFGLVIVTVIVVVATPPTGTVEGVNDFDIVSATCAISEGAQAKMTRVEGTKRRSASIGSAPSIAFGTSIACGSSRTASASEIVIPREDAGPAGLWQGDSAPSSRRGMTPRHVAERYGAFDSADSVAINCPIGPSG